MSTYLTYGYRMGPRGRIEHRRFDADDLRSGEAARNGWVDSPDKIQGGVKAIKQAEVALAETADTVSPEPKMTGAVYGERRKPGRPRK